MSKYYKITPEGSKDILFEECMSYTNVCGKIQKVFETKGYHHVITPCFEFYDLFSMEHSGIPQETMFKTTDTKGRLMVARCDSTLPIARMAATRLRNETYPMRLYYKQAVYRHTPTLSGKTNETQQMGIELLGAEGKRADLEVITAAIDSIHSIVPDFRIEIGHSGFFNALANQLPVNDELKEEIRTSIESKNYSALNNILDKLEDSQAVTAIRKLPRLFGGEEVFETASDLCQGNTQAEDALAYLKDLYQSLCSLGSDNKLIIDLGLVQRNEYYSGIVFTGYVDGCGDAVISGGRYDKLLNAFDMPMGAAGFGININALVQIYLNNNSFAVPKPEILVYCADGYEIKAINHTKELNVIGKHAQFCVIADKSQAEAYAEKLGIKKLVYIGE